MPESRLVLVAGATGNQGGAVARALLARGHRVRALTRDPSSPAAKRLSREPGVEVVAGGLSDHDALLAAAQGTDTVFAMTTPFEQGVEGEVAQGVAIVGAVEAAGVGHLVFDSVASADQTTGVPHFDSKYEVERRIEASGVPYTIVAPVYFMDNLLRPATRSAIAQGTLAMALPADRPLQQVAAADIGAFVASMVERREAVFGLRIDIAGDEPTGTEAAAVLSDVVGREVRYEETSTEALRQISEDMALMYEWFDGTGYRADIEALRKDYPEVDWRDFGRWAAEQDWEGTRQDG